MIEIGSRVTGAPGVFFAEHAASGVVMGHRTADVPLIGVLVDGEAYPAWVPAASVTQATSTPGPLCEEDPQIVDYCAYHHTFHEED